MQGNFHKQTSSATEIGSPVRLRPGATSRPKCLIRLNCYEPLEQAALARNARNVQRDTYDLKYFPQDHLGSLSACSLKRS